MKTFIKAFLSLCLLAVALSPAFASVYTPRYFLTTKYSKEDVRQALVLNQKWVDFPAYSDRAGWDRFLGDRKAAFIEAGEKCLDYTWRVIKATDYLEFERSGARWDGDKSANLSALSSLLMAELAEGKGRFLDQIINGIYVFSESTSWANTAHNSLQKSRRAIQAWDDPVFDLTAGTTSNLLSWVYYYLHDELDKTDPEISRRLYHELKRRILDVFLTNDSFWWMVRSPKKGRSNNWTPWCNYNALNAFMLLENDLDRLTDAVWLSMQSVDEFLNYTQEDGACDEGPGYWDRAAGAACDYLELLGRITGGKLGLFDHPMLRNMGEYIARSYVGKGWVVNFADASARGGGSPFLIYRFGEAVNSPILKGYAATLYTPERNISSGADVYRTLAALTVEKALAAEKPAFEHPAYTWYPQTDVCYMTDEGLFVATKGGYNNESHNHNDCGTVSFYVNTIPLLIDVGVGTYTRQTFSGERYTIWTMQSNYHNVPMINGVAQRNGNEFKATGSSFDPARMTYSTDISKAYPEEAQVRKWVRSCTLKDRVLTLKDDFVLSKAVAPNVINFMTWGKVDISTPGMVRIAAKGQAAVLSYDKRKFTASIETKALTDPRLSNVWGSEVYRISLTAKTSKVKDTYVFTVSPAIETMDQLTDRVFDIAKVQMIQMDSRLSDSQMPRSFDKGEFIPSNLNWWCSGFYPGSLWYVWKYTGDEEVRKLAEKNTLKLDGIKSVAHDHDIGFQINCSFGNALRLTGEERWAEPVVTAANALTRRFNPKTGVIKSWNSKGRNGDWLYPVIIDNMMNLELLMEGYRLSGTDSLRSIAMTHANTTMKHHFRDDYTTFHVVDYDPETGAVRHQQTAQGLSDDSAWARGQAWGLYGYTMMAEKTGDPAYLAQAHAIAKMIISYLPEDGVPYWDFNAPNIPDALRDASAGAIIASALVKLSQMTTVKRLAETYAAQAERTLRTLASDEYLAPAGTNGNFLLRHSVGSLPGNSEVDVPLTYADYYFLEALLRIKGMVD